MNLSTTPGADAATSILTWQERLPPNGRAFFTATSLEIVAARDAEIADLRAALAPRVAADAGDARMFSDWYTGITIEGDMHHNMRRAWSAALATAPAESPKPFAYFVQPSGFGPFIECKPLQVGCFPAYRDHPAATGAGILVEVGSLPPNRIRFDCINADGNEDSHVITHDEMRGRYAAVHRMAVESIKYSPDREARAALTTPKEG